LFLLKLLDALAKGESESVIGNGTHGGGFGGCDSQGLRRCARAKVTRLEAFGKKLPKAW
jgi:hypothetical protein